MKEEQKRKIYRLLGAEVFQKVVFQVEKLKYKIIDKYFPNIGEWYEKQLDKKYQKIVRKGKVENEKALRIEYQKEKLAFRKELHTKKNRNYHYDANYPIKFITYLKRNKKLHQKGMIKNIVVSLITIGLAIFFPNLNSYLIAGILSYEAISFFVNFQCINLQNYNLCRFQNKKIQSYFTRKQQKTQEENIKILSAGMNPVAEAIYKQEQLPSIQQVVENIKTKQEAKQLLEYAKKLQEKQKQTIHPQKTYIKKGTN